MSESVEELIWRTVSSTAEQLLVDVERVFHKPGFVRLLRVWYRPTFGARSSWTVVVPEAPVADGDDTPVGIELVWDRQRDYETIFHPKVGDALPGPTIRMREAFLPRGELAALLRSAPAVALPVGPAPVLAAPDGVPASGEGAEAWGAEVHGNGAVLHLEWAEAAPPEWQPIIEWSARLRGLLDYCFDPWVPASAIDYGVVAARGGPSRGDEQLELLKCARCHAVYLVDSASGVAFLDPDDLTKGAASEIEHACTTSEPAETPEERERPSSVTWRRLLAGKWRWLARSDAVPSHFAT